MQQIDWTWLRPDLTSVWTPSLVRCAGRFVDHQHTGGGWPHADRADQQLPQCRPQIIQARALIIVKHCSSLYDILTCCSQRRTSASDRSGTSETSSTPLMPSTEKRRWMIDNIDVMVNRVEGWAEVKKQLAIIDCSNDVVVQDQNSGFGWVVPTESRLSSWINILLAIIGF